MVPLVFLDVADFCGSVAEFCGFLRNFADFCGIVAEVYRMLQMFAELSRNFAEFCGFVSEFCGMLRTNTKGTRAKGHQCEALVIQLQCSKTGFLAGPVFDVD